MSDPLVIIAVGGLCALGIGVTGWELHTMWHERQERKRQREEHLRMARQRQRVLRSLNDHGMLRGRKVEDLRALDDWLDESVKPEKDVS